MSAQPVTIGQYRSVLSCVERMRDHARRQDWAAVSATADQVARLTASLRGQDPALLPDRAARRERLAILTQIVRLDAEIRHLRDPRLARLDALLTPAGPARSRTTLPDTMWS